MVSLGELLLHCYRVLKVHKNENFLAPILNFVHFIVSHAKYKGFVTKFFDWATIGGDSIISLSQRLRGTEFSLV